jgi:hypothetical protein
MSDCDAWPTLLGAIGHYLRKLPSERELAVLLAMVNHGELRSCGTVADNVASRFCETELA